LPWPTKRSGSQPSDFPAADRFPLSSPIIHIRDTHSLYILYKLAEGMDGRGRAFDNIFVERLWRTVKYEDVYLKEYDTPLGLEVGLTDYFFKYDYQRPHQSL
jgi:transposase InsO family protein